MTFKPKRRTRRRAKSRSGAVIAEFAIILPVFLLAIIGIIEFGRAVMVQQICVNAAREGARRAIIPGATDADVLDLVDNYLVGGTLGAPSRTVQILNAAGDEASLDDIASHDVVMVRVAVPYDEVGVGISSWFADVILGAVVQMRRE